ncbi:MAG: SIMPL domain-containing protein [Acidocella sp.]|nr:SIMPL domain-containing protein [Acidocella sp.]
MKILLLICLLFSLGQTACWAQTTLNLSAVGTDIVAPDEMTAGFSVMAQAPTAAAAQASVNQTMAKALTAANSAKGVRATTGSYFVNAIGDQTGPQKPAFQAEQTLQLKIAAPGGKAPEGFTDLVGQLQHDGLLLRQLSGQLSAGGEDAAKAAATVDAINKLQAQANAVAQTLGDNTVELKTLSIDNNVPGPVMFSAMRVAAAAPVQSEPGPLTISVTISATFTLTPRHQ